MHYKFPGQIRPLRPNASFTNRTIEPSIWHYTPELRQTVFQHTASLLTSISNDQVTEPHTSSRRLFDMHTRTWTDIWIMLFTEIFSIFSNTTQVNMRVWRHFIRHKMKVEDTVILAVNTYSLHLIYFPFMRKIQLWPSPNLQQLFSRYS